MCNIKLSKEDKGHIQFKLNWASFVYIAKCVDHLSKWSITSSFSLHVIFDVLQFSINVNMQELLYILST